MKKTVKKSRINFEEFQNELSQLNIIEVFEIWLDSKFIIVDPLGSTPFEYQELLQEIEDEISETYQKKTIT